MFVFSRFLRYFVEVARLGSIRRASEHLNVAASAINRQILQAEDLLKLPLFERVPSGLRPTAAGEMLLAAAATWRRDFDRVSAQMDDLKGLRRGHVRVAVIDALSKGFVVEAVGALRLEHPGISFTLSVVDNVAVMDRVVSGDADFGIMLDPQISRDVRVQAHLPCPIGFVTAPGHPLASGPGARFSQCLDYPVLAPGEPLALSDQFRALQRATGVPVAPVVTCDNIQMIKSLAADGIGVGVLSWLDVIREVQQGELAFTPILDRVVNPLTLAICLAEARQLSSAAHLFLNRVEACFEAFARPVVGPPEEPSA